MNKKNEIIPVLLKAYHDVTGHEGDPASQLNEALSSLELLQFLLTYENGNGKVLNFHDLRSEDLFSIETFATYLEKVRHDDGTV